MSAQIKNFTDAISALIQKEVEATLARLHSKMCKSLNAKEEDVEIDFSKFAENTVKKIVESENFTDAIKSIKKSSKSEEEKEKKDPDAPKGAKNAYIFFCNDKRDQIKKANPTMKATEITSKMGEMWKELSDKKKAVYKEMAEEDKKRYAEELDKYEPKEGFKNPKESPKKKKAESTAPKRARSAYIFFCTDKREQVKKANPSITNNEILSELGKMWKALTDKKKKPYVEKADADKKRYEEEMKNYVPTEEEKEAKEKKSKGKSGKTKVTRTPSGYLLFCNEKRDQVKSENPDAKMTEVSSILGKMWSELSDKKKKPYLDRAAKLKAEKAAEKSDEDESKEKETKKKAKKEEIVVEEDSDEEEEENEDENDDEGADEEEESILSDDEEEEEVIVKPKKTSK